MSTDTINTLLLYGGLSLIIGFLFALMIASRKRAELNNVHEATSAASYLSHNDMKLRVKQDHYLRTDRTSTRIAQPGGHMNGPGGFNGHHPGGPGGGFPRF